jgi:glucan biosynthesis protein C
MREKIVSAVGNDGKGDRMQAAPEATLRRYELDWLRFAAILAVFFFHALHFFDTEDWLVKNPANYLWIDGLRDMMVVWLMPLFFLISGASVFYAAKKRTAFNLVRDKVMRLLVPLLVGVFSFSLMQVYLERITHGQFRGSFIQFIPHYFEGLYLPGGTGNFAFHGMHLWYLLFLLVFTLGMMPFFWWCQGKRGGGVLRKLGDMLAMPGVWILLSVPTIILHNITWGNFIEIAGWGILQYFWFFLAGYIVASHQLLQLRIVKTRWVWGGLAVAWTVLSILRYKEASHHPDMLVWLELYAILGFAMKRLNFTNRCLDYANEADAFLYFAPKYLIVLGFFYRPTEHSGSGKIFDDHDLDIAFDWDSL